MTSCRIGPLFAAACSLTIFIGAMAAAPTKQTGTPHAVPALPKPGPEHALFTEDEGVWDAVVEIIPGPGAPPMTSRGVETNTVGCGGLCLITDFKGELAPGTAFHGHGTTAWDPVKKKYVGSWTDSMSQGIAVNEATWDPATRTLTGSMEGPDMSGKVVKMRTLLEYKGDRRVFTMYDTSAGTETQTMKITYSRKR